MRGVGNILVRHDLFSFCTFQWFYTYSLSAPHNVLTIYVIWSNNWQFCSHPRLCLSNLVEILFESIESLASWKEHQRIKCETHWTRANDRPNSVPFASILFYFRLYGPAVGVVCAFNSGKWMILRLRCRANKSWPSVKTFVLVQVIEERVRPTYWLVRLSWR